MLRQKYVAGTHYCHPIYAVINLYTVHNSYSRAELVTIAALRDL